MMTHKVCSALEASLEKAAAASDGAAAAFWQ